MVVKFTSKNNQITLFPCFNLPKTDIGLPKTRGLFLQGGLRFYLICSTVPFVVRAKYMTLFNLG